MATLSGPASGPSSPPEMALARSPVARRSGFARASFGVQHAIPLGILAQSALAGVFLYVDSDMLAWHNAVGTALLPLSLIVVLLAMAARFEPGHGLAPMAWVQFALLVAQHTLGLIGRDNPAAAALHVPNAFLIFTLAMLWLTRARRVLRGAV